VRALARKFGDGLDPPDFIDGPIVGLMVPSRCHTDGGQWGTRYEYAGANAVGLFARFRARAEQDGYTFTAKPARRYTLEKKGHRQIHLAVSERTLEGVAHASLTFGDDP
jgi:hypothetical protein